MATTQTDYILQELLNQTAKENDNLTAMRELLVELNKNLTKKPGNGAPSNTGSRPKSGNNSKKDEKKYSTLFKDMFGNFKGAATTIGGNDATAANVMGSIGTSVKGVTAAFSKLPGPIGVAAQAFSLVADAGMAVYEYLNAQLTMYNQLNSAGLLLTTGITTLERGAANSLLSVNEFSAVLTKNSDVIAAMEGQYGNGVEQFGKLLNTVQQLQTINGLYGVSQQQLADLAARNFKYQKIYNSQEAIRNMDQASSTDRFVSQMVTLSRTVGKSVDQMLAKFDDMTTNFDSHTNALALVNFAGMAEDTAAEVNKSMNIVFSAMGETGAQLQKLNASKNSLAGLPDDFNNIFTQMLTDRMMEIQRRGVRDPEIIQKELSTFVKQNQAQLKQEIQAQVQAGNQAAATFLMGLQDSINMLNERAQDVNPVMEEFTNRFNTWLSDSVTKPFKEMWANTRDSTLKYLMDTYDSVDGFAGMPKKMLDDLANVFGAKMGELSKYLMGIPGQLMSIVFNNFDGVEKAFGDFVNDLIQIPIRLSGAIWGLLTGDGWENSTKELKDSISGTYQHFMDVFTSLGDLEFNYDDMKTKIMDSFESMKKSISSWWDSAKGWFSGETKKDDKPKLENKKPVPPPPSTIDQKTNVSQPTSTEPKKTQPKVIEPPSYTKPVKVENVEPKQPTTEDQTQAQSDQALQESILKVLNSLMSATEQANQINTASNGYMRQVAENTAAQQNL